MKEAAKKERKIKKRKLPCLFQKLFPVTCGEFNTVRREQKLQDSMPIGMYPGVRSIN